MKRLSVFMLCAVIVLFSVIGYHIPVEANNKLSGNEEAFYDNTWLNNFDYTLSDNNLILNRYTGSATDLVIPSKATVDGVEYNVKLNNYCGYLFSGNQSLRTIIFDRYIDTIFHMWKKDKDFIEKFKSCKGFCTKHYGILYSTGAEKLNQTQYDEFLVVLNKVYFEGMDRVNRDMSWFIDKHDYRNKEADWGSSRDSLQRALVKVGSTIVEEG